MQLPKGTTLAEAIFGELDDEDKREFPEFSKEFPEIQKTINNRRVKDNLELLKAIRTERFRNLNPLGKFAQAFAGHRKRKPGGPAANPSGRWLRKWKRKGCGHIATSGPSGSLKTESSRSIKENEITEQPGLTLLEQQDKPVTCRACRPVTCR